VPLCPPGHQGSGIDRTTAHQVDGIACHGGTHDAGIVAQKPCRHIELLGRESDQGHVTGFRGSGISASREVGFAGLALFLHKDLHWRVLAWLDRCHDIEEIDLTAIDLYNHGELERIQTDFGPWVLYAGKTGGRATGQLHSCGNHMQRAIGMHGAFVKKVGDYSTGAGQTILPYVLGSTEVYSQGTSWSLILEHSKTIVLWASDPMKNLQVGWNCETHEAYAYLAQLKEKIASGEIKVISIDPVRSKTQNYLGCEQLYINPQTDVPFMLAIAHTLYMEDLHDKEFLDTYALGFKEFLPYLLGEAEDKTEKTPKWAEAICGAEADVIREFARQLAADRTQLIFGWAIQRQQHGEQPYWTDILIPCPIIKGLQIYLGI